MIISRMLGGLGNQMFQYAFGYATSKRLGVDFKLDLSDRTLNCHQGFELANIFSIKALEATVDDMQSVLGLQRHAFIRLLAKSAPFKKITNHSFIEEPHFHFAPDMLRLTDASYISGYWQSEKYFEDYAEDIRREFEFKIPTNEHNASVSKHIASVNSVSIHLRRGDYLSNYKAMLNHGLCSLEYYRDAVQLIAEEVFDPHFFVFSDDILWASEHLKFDAPCTFVGFNQGADSYNDMRLMSQCQHHIVANSSFSWWGAWLNSSTSKVVVAPKRWFQNSAISCSDLCPPEWVRI